MIGTVVYLQIVSVCPRSWFGFDTCGMSVLNGRVIQFEPDSENNK